MRWQSFLLTAAALALIVDAAPASAQTAAQRRARAIQARNQQRNVTVNNTVVFNPGINPFQPYNPFVVNPYNNPFLVPPFNPFVNNFPVAPIAPVGRPIGIRPVGIRPVYNRDLNQVVYPGANPFLFNNNLNPFFNPGLTPFYNPALNPFGGVAGLPAGLNGGNPFAFNGLGAFGLAGGGNLPFGNLAGFQ